MMFWDLHYLAQGHIMIPMPTFFWPTGLRFAYTMIGSAGSVSGSFESVGWNPESGFCLQQNH